MALFPLFIDLSGRKCVIAGGGDVAARKIETLAAFGADIVVISPSASDTILALEKKQTLRYCRRKFEKEDLEGAFLAVAATSDRRANSEIAREAARRHIFVNVADEPEECTFIFPSVAAREGLVVGITSSGAYPALSRLIGQEIGNLLECYDEDVAETLVRCRKRALAEIGDRERRRAVLNRLAEAIFAEVREDE